MLRRTIVLSALCACSVSVILVGQGARQGGAGPDAVPEVKVTKRDYDMEQLLKSTQTLLSEDAKKGRNLWLQRCAFCHDGVGTPTYNTLGPWLDSALVTARGEATVRDKILKGSAAMPGFQYGLRSAQVDQLVTFLKTIGPDQKPTDAQRAGKSALPGGDL